MPNDHLAKINENNTPPRGTTRARLRPPAAESGKASKVRHDEETVHREVDLNARKLENGSKPVVKKTLLEL